MAPNSSTTTVFSQSAIPSPQVALPHLQIIDRLVEYSLVNNALGYANQRYSALKSSNQLINQTLNRAEKSIHLIVTSAVVPVLNQLQQPIKQADNLAVQSLDLVQQKIHSFQKSSDDLKQSTMKLADQTKGRVQALKSTAVQTVQSKVNTVLTLPSNVVPLLDQVLIVGENVLDYLLPSNDPDGVIDSSEAHSQINGSPKRQGQPSADDAQTVLRLIFVRMRVFTEKVQKRIVEYSRQRWLPTVFESVIIIRGNVIKVLAANSILASRLISNVSNIASSTNNSSNKSSNTNASNTTSPVNHSAKTSTSNNSATNKWSSPTQQQQQVAPPSEDSSTSSPLQSNGDANAQPPNQSYEESESINNESVSSQDDY